MEQYAGQTAYVTLKDQFKISKKKQFQTKLPCQLISSAKKN